MSEPTPAAIRNDGPWSPVVDGLLLWGLGLVMTPLAGAVGGLVIWIAMLWFEVSREAEVGLALAVFGGIFGSLIAAPVTLIVLPVAGLALCRFDRGGRYAWWLPVAGAIAGAMTTLEDLGSFDLDPAVATLSGTWAIAGTVAGLVVGVPFAVLVRLRARRK